MDKIESVGLLTCVNTGKILMQKPGLMTGFS